MSRPIFICRDCSNKQCYDCLRAELDWVETNLKELANDWAELGEDTQYRYFGECAVDVYEMFEYGDLK